MEDHSAALHRAILLMQQNRNADAEKELRRVLADDPNLAIAHALLSRCLTEQKRTDESIREADMAVGLEPNGAYIHFCRAYAMWQADRNRDALESVDAAIGLEYDDESYHSLRGGILMSMNRWEEARTSLRNALAINPEHETSLSQLSFLESRLGNADEAAILASTARRSAPENSAAHSATGMSLVHQGKPREAFDSFREALRLDPNCEMARHGLILSLKMHHWFYRMMFKYFSSMMRLSGKLQWTIVIGFYIIYRILVEVLEKHPQYAPIVVPLMILYLVFFFFSWLADPLTYALLWFSRWGRMAMSIREKLTGAVFACMFIGGGVATALGFSGHQAFLLPGVVTLLLLIPVCLALLRCTRTESRGLAVYAGAMAVVGLATIATNKPEFLTILFIMFIAFQFLANALTTMKHTPKH